MIKPFSRWYDWLIIKKNGAAAQKENFLDKNTHMRIFDRYTLLRWKEAWGDAGGSLGDRLLGLFALCNANMTSRLVSLGVIAMVFVLIGAVAAWVRPEPAAPMNRLLVQTKTDAQGDRWALDYLKNQDVGALVNGLVKPGEPLVLTVKFLQEQRSLLMQPELQGAAGERYFPGILKNGQWQAAPKLVLTDQNDRLLHEGQFEYG